ncbi:MAG: cobalamin-dependent protein [Gemmatimonadetes bacterium]|nr:cobalamin-dependent protein [Gemmatimonadota bacterium]
MERFNSDLHLTTSQVAELLSVHPSTVKRWCNDGDLDVDKTDGGHRRIHLQDVLRLSADRAIPTFLDPFQPYEGHVWTAVNHAVDSSSFHRVHSLAMGWLTRGYIERLGALFHALGRHPGVPFHRFCDEGVRGFMREVGETWRSGRLRVGEEHMVSEALVEVLVKLRAEIPAPPAGETRPVAIVGSMEGDRHNIGGLCVRLILESHGWEVFFLGADVPVEDFAAMQRTRSADLVCVSFAPPNTAADMKRAIRILGEFYQDAHPYTLALGGDLSESPFLEDLEIPFRELGLFGSLEQFDRALGDGLGVRNAAIDIDEVA